MKTKSESFENLEDGHYLINGTSRVLYYQNGEWFKPVKNSGGRYSGHIMRLDAKPRVKSVEKYNVMGL